MSLQTSIDLDTGFRRLEADLAALGSVLVRPLFAAEKRAGARDLAMGCRRVAAGVEPASVTDS